MRKEYVQERDIRSSLGVKDKMIRKFLIILWTDRCHGDVINMMHLGCSKQVGLFNRGIQRAEGRILSEKELAKAKWDKVLDHFLIFINDINQRNYQG